MPKQLTKPNNPNRWNTPALAGLVLAGFVANLGFFLRQPSVLGFVDQDGNSVSRIVDVMQIMFLEQLFDGMSAGGRLEVGVIDRLPLLFAASGWLALAWWLALPITRLATLDIAASRLELHSLSILCGLSILSTTTLLVGLASGLGSRWPLLASIAVLLISRAGVSRNVARRPKAINQSNSPALTTVPENMLALWLSRLIPVAVVGLVMLYVLGSLMTPWEFDVVEYHLQAPKEFFQAGEIRFNAHNIYANMPLAAEMHSLAAMTLVGGHDGWWWGGLIGKAVTGFHSLIAAALLAGFVGRRYGIWIGWVAAGLLLAAPGNAHVAMAGLIDMVLGTYLLASLVMLTQTWTNLLRGKTGFWSLLLTVQFAGAAAACKYTGLLFVVIPVFAAITFTVVRGRWWQSIPRLALAGLSGLALTCLPWYAKNWLQAGNPFFPLAYGFFGGRDLSPAQAEQWQNAHRVPVDELGSSYSLGELRESLLQVSYRTSFLDPSLIFFVAVGLSVAWFAPKGFAGRWLWGWLAVAFWLLAVWWLATHRIDRFWLPVLVIWCAVAAVAAAWLAARLPTALASSFVLLGLSYGAFISASGALGDNRFFVSLHALREDIGSAESAGRLSPAVAWVNRSLAENGSKLLLIGEAKAYDYRLPIVYATCFNTNAGEAWLRDKSASEQRANLHTAGITHILINWNEIDRYRSPGNYGFSAWPQRGDIQQLIASQLLRELEVPWDPTGVQVLEVAR